MKQFLYAIWTVIAVGVMVVSCRKEEPNSSIKVSPSSITISTKETKTLEVFNPKGGKLSFSSANPMIASVSNDGQVRAITAGKTTITVSSGAERAVCSVEVKTRINYLFEPYLVFGAKKEDIKTLITAIGAKNIEDTGEYLYCVSSLAGEDIIYVYKFTDGRLSMSGMSVNLNSLLTQDFTDFILERFFVVSQRGEYSYDLVSPEQGIRASLSVSDNSILALFLPPKK